MNKMQQNSEGSKKAYQTPQLKKVGELKKITLKSGSASDSSLPRVV